MFKKYKTYIVSLIVIAIIVFGGVEIFLKIKNETSNSVNNNDKNSEKNIKNNEKKEYKVLVFIRNQTNSNPDEDKRSSMKKGYVVGVYEKEHKWSSAEENSFLILKMKLTDDEKTKLTQQIKKEMSREKLSKEEKDILDNREEEKKEEVVGMRAYKINLKKIGFDVTKKLSEKQPFKDSVFDWDIVEKVE